MTDDLVKELRSTHPNFDEKPMCEAAADRIELLVEALEIIQHIHDQNPSDAMSDMADVDYARHMLWQARSIARAALNGGQMTDKLRLVCGICDHVWTVCDLPIEVNKLAEKTKHVCCPSCGNKHPLIYTGERK